PSAQQAAEARFIRALVMFSTLDGWDQVPYRDDLTDYKKLPTTLQGTACADFIISELNAIIGQLPDGPAYVANKDAARALLMKTLLNYAVFANRAQPDWSSVSDKLTQVVSLATDIENSPRAYALSTDIFTNFAPNNDAISTENIFTLYNEN